MSVPNIAIIARDAWGIGLGRRLEGAGFGVYWITDRSLEKDLLIQKGVEPAKILDTTAGLEAQKFGEDELVMRLARLEDGTPPLVNDLILMDRLINSKKREDVLRYLAHIETVVTDFLMKNQITVVSSGRDTVLLLACSKICSRLGIPYVIPSLARIPSGRFGFCLGHTEAEFIPVRSVTASDRQWAVDFLKAYRQQTAVPTYSVLRRKQTQFLNRLPSDFLFFMDRAREAWRDPYNDYSHYTMSRLIRMFWRRRLTALLFRLAPIYESRGRRPYLLYGLQIQPESSIDVMASFYTDQAALITQIARATPITHDLYVKLHPDDIGGVPRPDLLRLKQIPGVRLLSPHENGHALVQGADVVLTVTGTMAYEAGLVSVPAIMFGAEFFSALPTVHLCHSPVELPGLIRRLLNEPRTDHDAEIEDFLATLYANSFEGQVDEYFGPFTETDLTRLEHAYRTVLARLQSCPAPDKVLA